MDASLCLPVRDSGVHHSHNLVPLLYEEKCEALADTDAKRTYHRAHVEQLATKMVACVLSSS